MYVHHNFVLIYYAYISFSMHKKRDNLLKYWWLIYAEILSRLQYGCLVTFQDIVWVLKNDTNVLFLILFSFNRRGL